MMPTLFRTDAQKGICIVAFLIFLNGANAQSIKSYIPPTPTAASLGVYGQIPISEYDGVPNINIPLHTLTVDGFSLPVSLSYHSAGFRNADEASWVGLGWSLNLGGVITRAVRDKDDFSPNGYFRNVANQPCDNNHDQEPDMFYYNIPGKAGRFFIDGPSGGNTFTIRSFTKDNIKIEYNTTRGTWQITTEDGVIYKFEELENTKTTTQTFGLNQPNTKETQSYISSWYITSIELVTGARITYRYAPINTSLSRTYTSSTSDNVLFTDPWNLSDTCFLGPTNDTVLNFSTTQITTIVDNECVLASIEYPNGKMVFNTSTRTDLGIAPGSALSSKLASMQVYTKNNGTQQLLKWYELAYDYYDSNSGSPAAIATRLRLNSVVEKTPLGSFNPYTFTYLNNSLPDKYKTTENGFLGVTGLLNTITYPTGGQSVFSYQAHPMGGGARIWKIYSKNASDSFDVRRFEYFGGKLMGKLIGHHESDYFISDKVKDKCASSPTTWTYTVKRRLNSNSDFSALGEMTNAGIVGYDTVITWHGENGENGKKISLFENTAPEDPNYVNNVRNKPNFPVPVPLNTAARNGLLKDEYVYGNKNGAFVLLRYTHNDYTTANTVNTIARRFALDICFWKYTLTTEWVQLTGQTVYNYDLNGGNPVATVKQFFYDNPDNALPSRISTTDSKGDTVLLKYYYAKEKSAQAGGVYTTLLTKNIIGNYIDQEKYLHGTLIEKNSITYKDWNNDGKILKPETVQQQKGSASPVVKARYLGYDEHGNVLAVSKEGGKAVSYVWGYGKEYPVAEVNNAVFQQVNETVTRNYEPGAALNPANNNLLSSDSFTTNVGQTYNFSVLMHPLGAGTFNGEGRVKLMNTNGDVLFTKSYYTTNTYAESVTLPAATGTYYFIFSMPYAGTGNTMIVLSVSSSYIMYRPHYNIFHTSFEDLAAGFIADGKTGKKCVQGPTRIVMPYTPGNYLLSWWQKPLGGGSDWMYKEQVLNITGNTPDYVLGNNLIVLDEIRVHPVQAMMTTYTYTPQVGTTSKCDERNRVTGYEYDNLLRLNLVRDNDNNILKTVEYNYKK
jgi:hypothetical protein